MSFGGLLVAFGGAQARLAVPIQGWLAPVLCVKFRDWKPQAAGPVARLEVPALMERVSPPLL